jgi:subfamily B ATP-binding cassette protein MsbA
MSLIQSFLRLWPYIWTHRKLMFMSIFFAGLTALLWGSNLSIVYPVATIMLDSRSIPEIVQHEIQNAETTISKEEYKVAKCQVEIEQYEKAGKPTGAERQSYVDTLHERAKHQSSLATASRSLAMLKWCHAHLIPWVPNDKFSCFFTILILLALATVIKGACIYVQECLVGSLVELTVMDVRKACYRKTLGLDYQTISMKGTSSLMSLFTYEMNMLGNGLSLLGGKVIVEPMKAVTCIIFAFMVNWQLTLMSMLFVPIAGYMFYRFGKALKKASHKMIDSMSRIYKMLEETFSSMKIVMVYGNFRQHRAQFHRENKQYYKKAMKIVQIDSLTGPATELFGLCAAYVAVLPCAYLMLKTETSIWGIKLASTPPDLPTLALLYGFLAGVIDPIRKLSSVYAKLKRSSASADRVFQFLDHHNQVEDPKEPASLARHSESIEFSEVRFSYLLRESEKRAEVLHEISLKFDHGDVVLVVGENGSGKSTLVNLIPRYFDPTAGQVLIDGVNIQQARLRDLRNQMAVVTQETLLFDKTIRENIRYGQLTASNQEVEDAAFQAGVLQFIDSLPEGFDTVIGEKGGGLSGGQRQRIALARAFIRNPAILIMDEATSAIDVQSEIIIHQALKSYSQGRTLFMISHHITPSLLDFVTKIVVMSKGRAVGVGTHQELLKTCPVYDRIYNAKHDKVEKKSAA